MAATKQQKEKIALLVLLVVAALVWFQFFGKARVENARSFKGGQYQPIDAQDYRGEIRQLESTRGTQYKASGRNIFVARPEPIAAPPKPKPVNTFHPQGPQEPPPPPPPPKPELGMKFFGLGATPINGPKRAFLQDGDEALIVAVGDTVKNHIRITHIGNDRIEFEDINTGMKNTATLEMPPSP